LRSPVASVSAVCGELCAGQVNGRSLVGVTHHEAVDVLKEAGNDITMVISRLSAVLEKPSVSVTPVEKPRVPLTAAEKPRVPPADQPARTSSAST